MGTLAVESGRGAADEVWASPMTTPWTYTGPVTSPAHSDSSVTLVEGQTFCLSSRVGDFVADAPHGLFVFDTRRVCRGGSFGSTATRWSH